MAIDAKYGKLDIKGIRADETIFILRGQDLLAPSAIYMYADMLDVIGRHEMAMECRRVARDMAKQSKKLPD